MLEDLQPKPRYEIICQVKKLADTLEPSDKKILLEAAVNPAWSVVALCKALKTKGLHLNDKQLARHRKGECPC